MEGDREASALKSAGIRQGSKHQRTTYNRSGQAVVAIFRHDRTGTLYYRERGRTRYRRVAPLGKRTSYAEIATASAAPVVLVNVREFIAGSEGVSWHSVARLDIRTGGISPLFLPGDVKLAAPYTRGWVHEILESWSDGRGAVCVMSFERPATAAEKRRWRSQGGRGNLASVCDHYVCDLDLEQKTYERLTLLRAIFF